jgi:hypothetical protein
VEVGSPPACWMSDARCRVAQCKEHVVLILGPGLRGCAKTRVYLEVTHLAVAAVLGYQCLSFFTLLLGSQRMQGNLIIQLILHGCR